MTNKATQNIHCEITPLTDNDLFVVLDNKKAKFDYPIHYHRDYELNIIMNTEGKRVVGDIIEDFCGIEVVLIGPRVPHAWRAETTDDTHVITIQFDKDFANTFMSNKKVFEPIYTMLSRSKSGIHFVGEVATLIKKKSLDLCSLEGFDCVLKFYDILNTLATSDISCQKLLASTSFDSSVFIRQSKSRRIEKICNFIEENYSQDITLDDIAEIANMSSSAVSHFFKKRTSRTFINYLTDIRLGYAARMLVETTRSVNDIAYECGFGNISNFNRVFKKYKNQTPRDYRADSIDMISKY
ncbi:MAG: AraC family transcriptional regulator [Rikenellaceae bacterium]